MLSKHSVGCVSIRTKEIYAHLLPDYRRAAVERLAF
jgi:hypothetical protein